MVQVISQEGLGEKIGSAAGKGFSSGMQTLLKHHMDEMLAQKKALAKAAAEEAKPYSSIDVAADLKKLNFDKDQLSLLGVEDYSAIADKANQLIGKVGRVKALEMAMQQHFGGHTSSGYEYDPSTPNGAPLEQKEGEFEKEFVPWNNKNVIPEGFGSRTKEAALRGSKESIPGLLSGILTGQGAEEWAQQTQKENPSFWENLVQGGAKFAGNIPFYAAGGAGGAAVGAPLGPGAALTAGAGALALPAAIETGLMEYQKWLDKGFKGSFGEFIDSVNAVGNATAQGAAEGAVLGPLQSLKFIKNVPGLKKLLDVKGGKAVANVLETGAKSGIFTTSKGVAKGEFPSAKEYANDLGMFMGIDLFGAAGKVKGKLYNALKKSNIPPQEAAQRIQEVAKEKNYDLNNPKDIARAVKDITKEPSKAKEVALPNISQVKTEAITPKETAERVAERPVEEYIAKTKEKEAEKAKPLTPREKAKRTAAAEDATQVKEALAKVNDDLTYLREKAETKQGTEQARLTEIAIKAKEGEAATLNRKLEDLESIARKGVKPYREEDIAEAKEKHMQDLVDIAKDPTSAKAEDINKIFERDQKYVDKLAKIADKGELPPAPWKDRYVKILDSYQKAYHEVLEGAKKRYSEAIKEPTTTKDAKEAMKRHLDLLEKNIKVNDAKIKTHLDRINSMYNIQKPGSAFVRQHLKSLRKDIADFQKEFIKQTKVEKHLQDRLDSIEARSLMKEKLPEAKLKAKEAESLTDKLESPKIQEKIDKEAEDLKVGKAKIKESLKSIVKELPSIVKDFKNNPKRSIVRLKGLYNKFSIPQQVVIAGVINSILKATGANGIARYLLLPGNTFVKSAAITVSGYLTDKYKDIRTDMMVADLVKKRGESIDAAMKELRKIKAKEKPAVYREVVKRYKQASGPV